jgi:hypothetical protein
MSWPPSRLNADGWRWCFVVVGIVLRLIPWARNPPLWQDEAALVLNVIHFDFVGFFGPLLHHQAAPPLFLALEKLALLTLGASEAAMRLPIVLAGCVSLVLFSSLARRTLVLQQAAMGGDRSAARATLARENGVDLAALRSPPIAAMIAVGLFAVSDRLIWHATEVKPYALDAFVAVAVAWGYVRTRHWSLMTQCFLWILVLPATIWFSYPTCFVAGGLILGLLPAAYRSGWGGRLMFIALGIAVAASFALLATGPAHAQRDAALSDYWVAQLADWHHPQRVPVWVVGSTMEVDRYALLPFGQFLALFAVIGAIQLGRRDGRLLTVLLAPALLTLIAALLGKYPFGGGRLNVFLAPTYILLVAAGVPPIWAWLRVRAWPALIPIVGLLLLPVGQTIFRTAVPWSRPDFRTPVAFVFEDGQPEDALSGDHWELLYYTRHQPERYYPLAEIPRRMPTRLWVITGTDPGVTEAVLSQVPPGWQRVEAREFPGTTAVLMKLER